MTSKHASVPVNTYRFTYVILSFVIKRLYLEVLRCIYDQVILEKDIIMCGCSISFNFPLLYLKPKLTPGGRVICETVLSLTTFYTKPR